MIFLAIIVTVILIVLLLTALTIILHSIVLTSSKQLSLVVSAAVDAANLCLFIPLGL